MNPRIVKLVETSLYVRDLERSERFYSNVLGLEVFTRKPGRHVFFKAGRGMLLVFNPSYLKAEKEKEGDMALPQVYELGKTHIAFEIRREDYDGWKQVLSENGVKVEHESGWGKGNRSIYFRDPDGNVVELIEPGSWPIPAG